MVFLLAMGSAQGVHAATAPTTGLWLPSAPFLMMAKKKKKKPAPAEEEGPKMTPDAAEPKRQAIRDSVQSARDAGNFDEVADGLARNAEQLGDPITMLESAEARLEAAKKDRKIATAEASIETAKVSLDMLHFYAAVNNGEATSDWLVMEPGDAGGLIDRADGVVRDAEALVEELSASTGDAVAAAPKSGKKPKRKRVKGDAKPGTGMIAAGSAMVIVGVAGGSMVIAGSVISKNKQHEVEKFMKGDPEVDKLDKAGKQANLIAYIGAGVAVVGLAVGLPLVIIGAKKRKQGKAPPASASTRSSLVLAPIFGGGTAALSLRGRF